MRALLTAQLCIFSTLENVWQRLASLDRYGHLWLPHTSAVAKKSQGDIGEHTLFGLSHFSSSSLCQNVQFVPMSELVYDIANDYARIRISFVLVEDANAVQLTMTVHVQVHGWRRWLGWLAYWYGRQIFATMPQRITKMVVQEL